MGGASTNSAAAGIGWGERVIFLIKGVGITGADKGEGWIDNASKHEEGGKNKKSCEFQASMSNFLVTAISQP
jgi:hypothetical protein